MLSRVGAIFNTTTAIYESFGVLVAVKLVKAAVLVILAATCARSERGPSLSGLMRLSWVTLAFYIGGASVETALGSASLTLEFIYLVSSGVNEGIVLFLYVAFMTIAPRCAVSVTLGFIATSAVNAVMPVTTGALNLLIMGTMRALGLVLAAAVSGRLGLPGSTCVWERGTEIAGKRATFSAAALVCAATMVNAISGFYATLPEAAGRALASADIGVMHVLFVLFETLLLVLVAIRPDCSGNPVTLVPAMVVVTVGLLLLPVYFEQAETNVGIMVARCGRDLFEIVSWFYAASLARRFGKRGWTTLLLVLAVSTYYVGAPFARLFAQPVASSEGAFMYTGIACASLVAASTACVFLIERGAVRPPAPSASDVGESPWLVDLQEFDARLLAFIEDTGISDREAAMLIDTVHGYSGEAIGRRHGYSRDAVKFSMAKVYARAGVSSRQDLLHVIESWSNAASSPEDR